VNTPASPSAHLRERAGHREDGGDEHEDERNRREERKAQGEIEPTLQQPER
jgi:hypothetical protein